MGCCIAIALVIALARAVWFRLFPRRRPVHPGFAPTASRPAPGAQREVAATESVVVTS